MTPTFPRFFLPLTLAALLASGCRGPKDSGDTSTGCAEPIPNAGVDQLIELGAGAGLSGSESDLCSGNEEFHWSFERVPVDSAVTDAALTENGTVAAVESSFVPDVVGDYVLALVLVDGDLTSGADMVVITVESGDLPPTADCGDAQYGTVGARSTLDGSASRDPEGAALAYSWALSSVPDCSGLSTSDVYNADQVEATVVPDCEGIYVVSLVVSDAVQWSDPDYCSIDVASGNREPIADAGDSGDLVPCTDNPMQLDGWGSYDPDGDEIAWEWSVVAVPADSVAGDSNFNDRASPEPYFTWDEDGTYVFQLQVYDGTDWSPPDVVSYTIASLDDNNPPIANAGDDQSVSETADCDSASYVWTCDDCESVTVELSAEGSTDPDGDPVTYGWTETTGVVTFSNDRSFYTDAILPPVPATMSTTTTTTYEIVLQVSDCADSDQDSVNISYSCTGSNSSP